MPVTVLNRIPSTPSSVNILVADAGYPVGYVHGEYVGMAVKVIPVNGALTVLPVGALWADEPQAFYGFLVNDANKPVLAVGRGSIVVPRILNAVPLVPNQDVYLSEVPGYVTQVTSTTAESSAVRAGYALDTTRLVISGDYRTDFY